MNSEIAHYSSNAFYQGRLRAHATVAGRRLFEGDEPVLFIDTAGCGFEEQTEGTNTYNPEEARFVIRHLALLSEQVARHYDAGSMPSVAVISPYRQQLHELNEALLHTPELKQWTSQISVNTIDSFQGQERDIVYISMTRSNSEQSIGFLSDIRRMNVAMTRAKKKLVVVGDSATLSVHPFYKGFIAYTEETDGWKSAWEWMQ
jgi:superfamily I DNA and/or RNA helicase